MTCSRIIIGNDWLDATITASSGVTLPQNTQNQLRGIISTSTGDASISFNFPTSRAIDAIYVAGGVDEVRLRLYANSNQTGAVMDTGWQPPSILPALGVFRVGIDPWGVGSTAATAGVLVFPLSVVGRSGILEFRGASTIQHITMGRAWQPAYGASYDPAIDHVTGLSIIETEGGSIVQEYVSASRRKIDFAFAMISDLERAQFVAAYSASRGAWAAVALGGDGDLDGEFTAVGMLQAQPIKRAGSDLHAISLTLTEF